MYKISIKDRFYEILHICDMTRRDFCKYIGIDERNFLRYIDRNSITQEHTEKIYNLGININWLLTGNEEKYNSTYNGQKLKKQLKNSFDSTHAFDNYILFKLDKWISLFYKSIRDFEELHRIKEQSYFTIIEKSYQLPMDLLNLLRKDGMNIKWLYNANESPFCNSIEGRRKKRLVLDFKDSECFIYNELRKLKWNSYYFYSLQV